MENVVLCLVS